MTVVNSSLDQWNYAYIYADYFSVAMTTILNYRKFKPSLPHREILRDQGKMEMTTHKLNASSQILETLYVCFYTPPHFSGEVLCYTLLCLSVCPCSPFPIDNLSIYSRNFFKFCIHIVIGDEWYGIVNGQNPSIFNGVTALFRIGKMVSCLLFLYCS